MTLRLAEYAEEGTFGLHPSVRAWGGEAQTKRRSCFRCLLIKRMGFGQGGSCRCLQNKEGGGRPEASLGPGVSAVPARLVWARLCPRAGHRRCPCCKRSTGREAGGGSTPGQVSPGGPAQGSVPRLCPPAAPRCPVPGSALPVTTPMAQRCDESHLPS